MGEKAFPSQFYLISIVVIAALGGVLFGYNTSVIAGALLYLKNTFKLDEQMQQMTVSMLLLGALVSTTFAGPLSDFFGRRISIMLSTIFYVLGAVILSMADILVSLLLGRFILGLGVGLTSVIIPVYIAEMSPAKNRGALVTINQLAITVGILIGYLVNLFYTDSQNWRLMFGYAILPALIQFLGMLFLPDTPNWLIKKGQKNRAELILTNIYGTERIESKISEIKEALQIQKTGSWRHFFNRNMVSPLCIGLGLSIFQQITGINAIIYYAPIIFDMSGFHDRTSQLLATLGIGIINVIATILAVWALDRIGRRKPLLYGLGAMTLSLLILAHGVLLQPFEKSAVLFALCIYVIGFAVGIGPVTWVILSEIFPLNLRGRGMSLALFLNWACNYLIASFFLSFLGHIGFSNTFLIFSGISLLALVFAFFKVPETKGRPLEEISTRLK